MITYDFIRFHVVAPEILPNVERHYTEMHQGDDYGQPDIDWDGYVAASHQGACYAATLRDDGDLVGYSVYSISNNPRYKTQYEAINAGIFVEQPWRIECGKRLVTYGQTCLAMLGVHESSFITNDEVFGRFLGQLGIKPAYKIYTQKFN